MDIVNYEDSYHSLMCAGLTAGVSGYGFTASSEKGSHMTRAGLLYLEVFVCEFLDDYYMFFLW